MVVIATVAAAPATTRVVCAVVSAAAFPRLRYMGSKYKLVPQLAGVSAEIGGSTALDAFSGSGVVAYTLKALGYRVATNDFLNFPSIITAATVELEEIDFLLGDDA